MKQKLIFHAVIIGAVLTASGCTTLHKSSRYDQLQVENDYLRSLVKEMEAENNLEQQRLAELENAKRELEQRLQQEIRDDQASLRMTARGLVVTFQDKIFFNSGQAEITSAGKETLAKVARVLNQDVPGSQVAIEGHTDNVPIKYSGWKSNWELSSARALAVLHDLIDDAQVAPQRLSAVGYGEFAPIADNATPQARRKNRRVEIVILPSQTDPDAASPVLKQNGITIDTQ